MLGLSNEINSMTDLQVTLHIIERFLSKEPVSFCAMNRFYKILNKTKAFKSKKWIKGGSSILDEINNKKKR